MPGLRFLSFASCRAGVQGTNDLSDFSGEP